MYNNKENIYWEYKGNIFIFLKRFLHKSLFLELVLIFVCVCSELLNGIWQISLIHYTISCNKNVYREKTSFIKYLVT